MSMLPAIANAFLGVLAISLEIAALAVSEASYKPDVVSSGIWGGVYLIMFAGLLKGTKLGGKSAVIVLATYALLVGITLIGIHSWSIDVYQDDIKNCELYYFFTTELCGRVAIDSLMIVCGILTVLVNGAVIAMPTRSQ